MDLILFAVLYVLVLRWIHRRDRQHAAHQRLGGLYGPYRRK